MPQVEVETLKRMLVENCMLKTDISQIHENTPLFGPNSVGLDSLDALQIAVAVEKQFGVPMNDPDTVRQVLQNLGTLRAWLAGQASQKSTPPPS